MSRAGRCWRSTATSPAATCPSRCWSTDRVELLIDLFGYLSIIVHGLTILAQSMALGGVLFLVFLARPLLRSIGTGVPRRTAALAAWSAVALAVTETLTVALQAAVLMGTLDIGIIMTVTADAALAGIVKIVASAALAVLLFRRGHQAWGSVLLTLCGIILVAATMTTHAA